jgi:hypothetical protein
MNSKKIPRRLGFAGENGDESEEDKNFLASRRTFILSQRTNLRRLSTPRNVVSGHHRIALTKPLLNLFRASIVLAVSIHVFSSKNSTPVEPLHLRANRGICAKESQGQ